MTTGISAEERTKTVRELANGNAARRRFPRPATSFRWSPRRAASSCARAIPKPRSISAGSPGSPAVGVLSEPINDDGTVMRGPDIAVSREHHKLKRISIADLIAYRQIREKLVKRIGEFPVNTEIGPLKGYAYVTPFDAIQHMALSMARIGDGVGVLARLHRANLIGDMFGGASRWMRPCSHQAGGARRTGGPARRHRGGTDAADPAGAIRPRIARTRAAMARDRPWRTNPQGPRDFLDTPAHLGEDDVRGT